MYGESLLSKVIDTNDIAALRRFAIDRDHFQTEGERQAFDFLQSYAQANRNQAPDYRTFVAECPNITYQPNVEDSFEYLARKLKDAAGKRKTAEFLNGQDIGELFEKKSTEDFWKELIKHGEQIIMKSTNTSSIGKTLTDLRTDFIREYNERKAGKSFKIWRTPFESLDAEIGGWYTSDIYGIMAESGRGKTYLVVKVIDSLLRQGAKCLVKSYETKSYLWLSRLVSIMTAEQGDIENERGESVGLPNKAILSGKLADDTEAYMIAMVEAINDYYPGELILQAKSDDELTRTLDDLERELTQQPDIDVVVLDPFYGLADVYDAQKNANRTTGGAAEVAASRFERICGEHDVVGFYTVQATVDKKATNEDGARELVIPTRDKVKTSARLLDIATNLIGFDSNTKEGIAALGIEKGRNGGEDFRLELVALLDYGVLREFPKGEASVAQFTKEF